MNEKYGWKLFFMVLMNVVLCCLGDGVDDDVFVVR